jgi:hypothetical protein
MPFLEVLHFTGDVSRHELSKGQPLTIGTHSTNDIIIDDDSVELMHCRVSWSKAGFEAVAAGVDGLDVNGSVVQRAVLKSGDTLRFGSVDVRFTDDGSSPAPDARPAKESSKAAPPAAQKPRKAASADIDDDSTQADSSSGGWNALEALASEARAPQKSKKTQIPEAVEPDTFEEIEEAEAAVATGEIPSAKFVEDGESDEPEEPKLRDRLRSAVRSQGHRPGEEDTLRSPLVLGLAGAGALLILLGGIFFFIAGRQDAEAAFNDAKAQYDQAKYPQAIELLDKFLETYEGSPFDDDARRIKGLSEVDQYIRGAAKKWPDGLEALRSFINLRQNGEDFESDKEDIHTRAYEIALGATQDAARTHERELIQVGQEAVTLLTTYLPADAQAAKIEEIQVARRASEAEILKHETLVGALAKIEEYVPEIDEDEPPAADAPPPDPIPALVARRNLLASYPELETDRNVVEAMNRVLEAERSLVRYTELNVDALTDDPQAAVPAWLSLVFNARSRLDAVSVGQCAFALSKDAIYGIDTVTGAPVWRRVIGFNSPFYPIEESTVPSVIVFDTYQSQLCRVNRNTGELLWRQPIADDDVRSSPILHEGQILLPTMGGSIYQIDLQTGRLIGKLTFSQEVTTPVPLADGKLVVAGNEEVAYTLTGRPFECVGVSYLGQQPGSVTAPLLSMGPYVAMIEGVSTGKSRLRLIEASENTLREVARADIEGDVYDTPVIRGRDLFVPSSGERVSTFSVSDDSNQPPLTVGPTFQVQNGSDNPVFLLTGPDRQLWMSCSALLKLQLTTEALAAEPGDLPIGQASQPLQYQSGVIFNGRRRAYSTAVTLAPVDRNEQTSEWQAQVGASLLAVSPASSNLICLTEEGGVFRLTDMNWTSSGFGPEPSTRLPLNPELAEPLVATDLGEGQIAVACGDPEPKLWIINVRGEIERSTLLESPLQAAPIRLGNGIVLPMQGRLKYQPIRAGSAGAEDFTLATDEALTSRWLQVVRLSDTSIAALTSAGDVLLIVLQSAPRPHLGEVSRFTLPAAVELPLQGDSQFLAVTDVNHNVQVFDTATLSPVAQRSFETAVWGAWSAGGQVFVQTDDGTLNLVTGDALTTSLQIPLNSVLVGPPTVTGNSALVALQNGEVFTWDLQSGEVSDFQWVGAALSQLPIRLGDELLFVTVDGSLIRLPAGSQVAAGAQTSN